MLLPVLVLAFLLCADSKASENAKSFRYDSTCWTNCSSIDGTFAINVMLSFDGSEKCPETVDGLKARIRDGHFLTPRVVCSDIPQVNHYLIFFN